MAKVLVNGDKSDQTAARDFIAGKVIIGKARIAESGVANVGDILRRGPAISVGKDGRLGLLGLPGYTQVLVDGLPAQGADPFELDLAHIESIEIIKSATAASGPFGIDGTINIIKRKASPKPATQLRMEAFETGRRGGANGALSQSGSFGDAPLTYRWSVSASNRITPSSNRYAQTIAVDDAPPRAQLDGAVDSVNRTRTVLASGELSWRIDADHRLSVSPDAGHIVVAGDSQERRQAQSMQATVFRQHDEQSLTSVSFPLKWHWQIDPDSSVDVYASVNRQRLDMRAMQLQDAPDAPVIASVLTQRRDISNTFFNVDFAKDLDGGHALTAGAKLAHKTSDNHCADFVDGRLVLTGASSLTAEAIRTRSAQFFVQDEWRINRNWAISSGVSAERRLVELGASQVLTQQNYVSPSLHVARKIGGDSKRQLRLSVARTFQPPSTDKLSSRPHINPLSLCTVRGMCGANSPDTADSSGNPALAAERALGVNLSYTQGWGAKRIDRRRLFARHSAKERQRAGAGKRCLGRRAAVCAAPLQPWRCQRT